MSESGLESLRRGLYWRRQWRRWQETLSGALEVAEEQKGDKEEEGKGEQISFEEAKKSICLEMRDLLVACLSSDPDSAAGLSAALLTLSDVLKLGRRPKPERDIGRSRPMETKEEKPGKLRIYVSL